MLSVSVEPSVLLALVTVALIAGIVDTLAGGGGLITVPTLLIAGVPPLTALGTNRLQACIGEFTAAMRFIQKGALEVKGIPLGIALTALGAILGTITISWLPKDILEKLLPILLISITIYAMYSNTLRRKSTVKAKMTSPLFMVCFGLLIGFYNGFFGPGTGSLWMLAFLVLLGRLYSRQPLRPSHLILLETWSRSLFSFGFRRSIGF